MDGVQQHEDVDYAYEEDFVAVQQPAEPWEEAHVAADTLGGGDTEDAGVGGAPATRSPSPARSPSRSPPQQQQQQQQQQSPGTQLAALAPTAAAAAATTGSAAGAAEEWEAMVVPQAWRPLPVLRVAGCSKDASEVELVSLLVGQGMHNVHSVVFDTKQENSRGRVAYVRFQPPPQAGEVPEGSPEAAGGGDAGKASERIAALLRGKQLELHGQKLSFERTSAELTIFLANLQPPEAESDAALRTLCEAHGTIKRCFVMRNPARQSKGYGFCEMSLPHEASALREAWTRRGESQRPPKDTTSGERFQKVKLQRAEGANIRTVPGLFACVLYVDNLPVLFVDLERLKRVFGAYGEVVHAHMPRNIANPMLGRGFAFVQFKRSCEADAAFRALDGSEQRGVGKLVISFSNPAKVMDPNRGPGTGTGALRQQHQGAGMHPGGRGGRGQAQGGRGQGTAGGPPGPAPRGAAPPPGATIFTPAQAMAMQQQASMQQRMMMQQAMMQRQATMQQMAMQQQLAQAQAQLQQKEAALQAMEQQQRDAAEARKREEEEEKARREAEYAYGYQYGSMAYPGQRGGGAAANVNSLAGAAAALNPLASAAAAFNPLASAAAFNPLAAAMLSSQMGLPAAALSAMAGMGGLGALAGFGGMGGLGGAGGPGGLGAAGGGLGGYAGMLGAGSARLEPAADYDSRPAGAGSQAYGSGGGGGGTQGYGGGQGYGDVGGNIQSYGGGSGGSAQAYGGGGSAQAYGGGGGSAQGYVDSNAQGYGSGGNAQGYGSGGNAQGYDGSSGQGYRGGSQARGGNQGRGGSNKRDHGRQAEPQGGGYDTRSYPPKRPRY